MLLNIKHFNWSGPDMSGKDKTDKVKKDDFQRGNLRSSEERLWLVRSEQIDRQQGSIII